MFLVLFHNLQWTQWKQDDFLSYLQQYSVNFMYILSVCPNTWYEVLVFLFVGIIGNYISMEM